MLLNIYFEPSLTMAQSHSEMFLADDAHGHDSILTLYRFLSMEIHPSENIHPFSNTSLGLNTVDWSLSQSTKAGLRTGQAQGLSQG